MSRNSNFIHQFSKQKSSSTPLGLLWDAFCLFSIIGIWPRFIEPRRLLVTRINLEFPTQSSEFDGFKILQISDLHYQSNSPRAILKKIISKVESLKPDLILITGDILTHSELPKDINSLKEFLQNLRAPYGSWAVFGNHDYEEYVTMDGYHRFHKVDKHKNPIFKGLLRIINKRWDKSIKDYVSSPIRIKQELSELLKEANIHILNNETRHLHIGSKLLNITGLGDLMAMQCDPQAAFKNYQIGYPGLVLCHNPDVAPLLKDYPGNLIVSGHTHGGQINLPFLSKRLVGVKNQQFKSGLHNLDKDKWIYINRGIGSSIPFRWFAPPELTLFTLKSKRA